MVDEVTYWLRLVRSDLGAARTLLSAAMADQAAQHAQQAAVKLLKALLTEHGLRAPRTHDLERLAGMLPSGVEPLADASLLAEASGWLALVRYGGVDEPGPEPPLVEALLDAVDAFLVRRGW